MFLMAIRCPKAASNVLHNWARLVFNSVKMHCDIKGLENIDPNKRYIIISNHGSMLDIPALVLVSPGICSWVMKQELMRIPVLNLMFASGMGIPIARANARKSQQKMIKMVNILASILCTSRETIYAILRNIHEINSTGLQTPVWSRL